MKKQLLIDGDQFLFTACIAVEKEIKWDDQNHVLYSNAVEARNNLDGMLERIFTRFKTRDHALTFTSGLNFRLLIDPSYKGNRVGVRKPLCYAELREQVERDYNCVAMPGLEADDVMGILATKPLKGKLQRIIVSQDKDMKSIPGTLWDGKDLLTISQEEADHFHLYQTLIGDTADGYSGCPGVGPVKAAKLLTVEIDGVPSHTGPPGIWWPRIVEAYTKANLTEADALVQARLARILRFSDWDSANKAPILWTP